MNVEWNVVKVKDLPHVTSVAVFQCGNRGGVYLLSPRTTTFHRGQTQNCSQHPKQETLFP